MDKTWLAPIAQAVFFVAAMMLTTRWLARSRQSPRLSATANRLAHPPAILILGVAGTLILGGAALGALISPDEDNPVLAAAVLGAFVLLPGHLVADYFFARHTVTSEGMDFGRLSGKRVAFRWDEVRRIWFGNMGNWFKIELQCGEVLRVSTCLTGLPAFAGQVLRHVPAGRIDKATHSMLERTAQGILPELE